MRESFLRDGDDKREINMDCVSFSLSSSGSNKELNNLQDALKCVYDIDGHYHGAQSLIREFLVGGYDDKRIVYKQVLKEYLMHSEIDVDNINDWFDFDPEFDWDEEDEIKHKILFDEDDEYKFNEKFIEFDECTGNRLLDICKEIINDQNNILNADYLDGINLICTIIFSLS